MLTESFYKEKKARASNEADHVIVAAAKLLKNPIKNHNHVTNFYPNIDENFTATNENELNLLRVFISELIKLALKQNSISEAIFFLLMLVQLGLAIFADNEFASKRLITLLYRLGFGVSYDEVSLLVCLLVIF